jgi:hypothetical protein
MTSILFEHFHGAVTRVGPGETAVPHRDPAYLRWARETHADLQPHLSARRWLNDLGDNQGDAATNRRATRTSETHTRQ